MKLKSFNNIVVQPHTEFLLKNFSNVLKWTNVEFKVVNTSYRLLPGDLTINNFILIDD